MWSVKNAKLKASQSMSRNVRKFPIFYSMKSSYMLYEKNRGSDTPLALDVITTHWKPVVLKQPNLWYLDFLRCKFVNTLIDFHSNWIIMWYINKKKTNSFGIVRTMLEIYINLKVGVSYQHWICGLSTRDFHW